LWQNWLNFCIISSIRLLRASHRIILKNQIVFSQVKALIFIGMPQ
jgi:hypothetical protein